MPLAGDFPEVDTTTASPARIYDYALGGTDNYQVDRLALEAAEDLMPGAFAEARSNRRYLERVVRYLAGECGIRQFVDFGSGLPAQNNVHQIAQQVAPGARVVYVDNDPVVLRHQKAGALLAEDESTSFILEDARNTERILSHPDTRRLIDLSEPAGVLYLSFLHMIPDADDPWGLVRRMMDTVAAGSFLAISHGVSDDPDTLRRLSQLFSASTGGKFGRFRERAEVDAFFEGLQITEPGLVRVAGWRAEIPADLVGLKAFGYGGVARKPG
ncbi:MAG: SAM-dependent methyltransferase [Actinobacteria bacterium]|nr:SAM-dependent methyltransferase [Actinomycetota bacterium]